MKREKIVYLLLLIMPIVDLITSLTSRFYPEFISLGVILKGLFIILSFIYVFFYSKSKYKKISVYYFIFILLYILLYFIFKRELLDIRYIKSELTYLFKFMYFPVLFTSLLNYFDCYGYSKNKVSKILTITLIIYILLIMLPTVLNINFKTYSNLEYAGSVGWFFSANEISTILLLLFPVIYQILNNNKVYAIILFVFSLFTISLIGTKVTLFGIVIISFLGMLFTIFNSKKNHIIVIGMFLITIVFMLNNTSTNNMKKLIDDKGQQEIVEVDINLENDEIISKYLKLKNIGISLLSDREKYAINLYNIYKVNYENSYLLFGMGYSNTSKINNSNIEKLIEIDFLDTFFHMGLIAIILIIIPFIYTIILFCKSKKININIIYYIFILLVTIGISSTAGHVYTSPAVSLYIIIYLIIIINEFGCFEKDKINDKKIAILALHLGYGGVENAVVSKASMLQKKYNVEIVSLYKQKYNIPYKINDDVKVTYLMNEVSNREEFVKSLKSKKWLKVIKEGFKSIRILALKNYLIANYIINSDAKIIISTRYEFSRLLNKYGRDNTIKIHEQHVYDISKNYIKKLDNLSNIDYIMPVSNNLQNNYNKLLKNKEKLKYIPLSLNYYPNNKETSKLNTRNIIAIGRLEEVKGYSDLIDVMKIVTQKDKRIKLNIFGDGSNKKLLEDKIISNKLVNNIILHGFKSPEYIKKYLQSSSLYAMTSYSESFGLVASEALSYGIPCITFSSAKGVLDIVNSNTGIIVEKRNINKYAEEILNYFNLDIKAKKILGSNGRKITEKYEFNNVQKEWLHFIEEILNNNEYDIIKYLKKLYKNDRLSYYKLLDEDLKNNKKRFIITVNPESIMMSKKDQELKRIMNNNFSYVPDGILVVKSCNYLNMPIKERITGIDIMEHLLNEANTKGYSAYFFGATKDVIVKLVNIIKSKYPNINILGYSDGYVKDKDKIMDNISNMNPDICFVAFGIPNQEKLIYRHLNKFKKGILVGVGGSFDVLSGSKKRAPKIFIKLNLEWLYRITSEPKRLKRFYESNIKYMFEIKNSKDDLN